MADPALKIQKRPAQALPPAFDRYRSEIDAGLRQTLTADHLPVYHMLRYAMGWSDESGMPATATVGKALRPTLCLFACEATGGLTNRALPAAISLELVHHFSLIHDDIQDRDEMRRHRPTLWAAWGEPKALVAGNTLRVIADMALWRLSEEGAGHETALAVTALLTEAYLEMIEGQYLDLYFEGRPDIGLHDYLDMISKKSGALIRCALNLGALIGCDDPAIVQAFRECGSMLGSVFQIRDDVLGIWGDEEATGKPVGADIRRKKSTLPVVYALSKARARDRELLLKIYRGQVVGDDEVSSVLEVMDRVGAREYAQEIASEYREGAMGPLSSVELAPEALRNMEEMSQFLLVREH